MAYLVLVRHGLSEYNEKGLWTGWDDPKLTPEGHIQAKKVGTLLKDIHFDISYTASLIRARQTLEDIIEVLGQKKLKIIETDRLNERDYGDFTKKNKWEIKKQIGEEEFHRLRRGWNYPIPNGESLKQTSHRIWPYFQNEILPKLKLGHNILISSSGNAIRALLKPLENLSEQEISETEIGIGEALVFEIGTNGVVLGKTLRNQNPKKGKI